MKNYFNSKSIALLILGFSLLGVILPLVDSSLFKTFFVSLSYPILLTIVTLWTAATVQFLSKWKQTYLETAVERSAFIASLLFGLATTIVIARIMPFEMKTNSDEANLLSVANSFYLFKQPFNLTEATYYFDTFHPSNFEIPSRPLMFPFLVHLIHLVNGMRLSSAFILNLIATFIFSIVVQTVTFQYTRSKLAGFAAWAMILAQPLILVYASSAGFDVLSNGFFFISLLLAYRCIQSKTVTPFFILTLAVFSHIRYENPLIALVTLGIVVLRTQKIKDTLFRWETALLVGSLVIHFWQRKLTPNSFENPPGVAVFSIDHFINHTVIMMKTLFLQKAPYHHLFILAFLFGSIASFRVKRLRLPKEIALIFGVPLLIQTVLVLSHHAGVFEQPTQIRFFIPLSIAASLYVFLIVFKNFGKRPSLLFVFAMINLIAYLPLAGNAESINTLTLNRDLHRLFEFVENQHSKRILIIYDRPVEFVALGYGAVSVNKGKSEITDISEKLNNGLYDAVYYFEESTYGSRKSTWGATSGSFDELSYYQQFGDHVMTLYQLRKAPR